MTITLPNADQINAAVRDCEAVAAYLDGHFAMLGAADGNRLFDPDLSPRLHDRVDAIMRHLHTCRGLTYVDHAPPGARRYDEQDPGAQGAVFLNYVSQPNTVHVLRDAPERIEWTWLWRTLWPQGRCVIGEAADCSGMSGPTAYVLVTRPPYLLVIETCDPCLMHLKDLAMAGEILAEADARVAFDGVADETVERWLAIRVQHDGEAR